MHCYHHPDSEAVGLCKICSKGLCSDCAIEIGDFLYCEKHAKMSPSARREEDEEEAPVAPARKHEAVEENEEIIAEAPVTAKAQHARPREAPLRAPERPRKAFVPKLTINPSLIEMVSPAIIGAIVGGTPSGIPFLNFACIIWMLAGGVVSVYVLMLKEGGRLEGGARISPQDAVKVGALSGLFSAGIAFIFGLFSGVTFWQQMLDIIVSTGLSQDYASLILRIIVVDPGLALVDLALKLVLFAVVFPVFGAIGGLVAAELNK